jgi:hypothetical protein
MQVRTETIAAWRTQSAGVAKLRLINRARSYIAKQQQYGTPCPEYMEVPESVDALKRAEADQ